MEQHCTEQRSLEQHRTAQHCTGQHNMGKHRMEQYGMGQHGTAQHIMEQYGMGQHGTGQHNTEQNTTGLDGTGQHGRVQRGTGQQSMDRHNCSTWQRQDRLSRRQQLLVTLLHHRGPRHLNPQYRGANTSCTVQGGSTQPPGDFMFLAAAPPVRGSAAGDSRQHYSTNSSTKTD